MNSVIRQASAVALMTTSGILLVYSSSMVIQFILAILIAFFFSNLDVVRRKHQHEFEHKSLPARWFFFAIAASILGATIAVSASSLFGLLASYLILTIGLCAISFLILNVSADTPKSFVIAVVAVILVYSLALRAIVYFSYPSIVGVDPWSHGALVNEIVKDGSIDLSSQGGAGIYGVNPVFHIFSSTGVLILGITTKGAMFSTVGIAMALVPLFVFFALRQLGLANRTCLLAALLSCVMCEFIRWGWWLIPSGLGFVYSATILGIVFKKGNWEYFVVFALNAVALTWTHPGSAFVTIIISICYLTIVRILAASRPRSENPAHHIGVTRLVPAPWLVLVLCLLLGVHMIQTETTYSLLSVTIAAFGSGQGFLPDAGLGRGPLTVVWNRLPRIEVLALAALGMILLSRNLKRNGSVKSLGLAGAGSILGLLFLGLYQLNPEYPFQERMLFFAFACALGVAGEAIDVLTRTREPARLGAAFAVVMATVLIFPSIVNYSCNLDPEFSGTAADNWALTENEMAAGTSLLQTNSSILTDSYFRLFFNYSGYAQRTFEYVPDNPAQMNYSDRVILVRDRGTRIPIDQSWSSVLDSGRTQGYLNAN